MLPSNHAKSPAKSVRLNLNVQNVHEWRAAGKETFGRDLGISNVFTTFHGVTDGKPFPLLDG